MEKLRTAVFVLLFGACVASPANYYLQKLDPDVRYQYATDSLGENHMVDLWMSVNDLLEAARFAPEVTNVYHLFTRTNPTVSEPLLVNNDAHLASTNFDGSKRTAVLIHGWRDSALSEFNSVVVPAFLAAEDINVIVVDWSEGASSVNYRTVIQNTISSGAAVARFINWINRSTGSSPSQFHVVGHGFGGHQAGIVGRNLDGNIGYITGLNPALVGWTNHPDRFMPNDGAYTEVIHTNYILGYLADLAQVDFYPNGGLSMPGCNSNQCDDARSYFYFAESLTSGGFTGTRCLNYYAAILSQCSLPGRLQMGGLKPKPGSESEYKRSTAVKKNASESFFDSDDEKESLKKRSKVSKKQPAKTKQSGLDNTVGEQCSWWFGSDDEDEHVRRDPNQIVSVLTRRVPGGKLRRTAHLSGDLLAELRLYNVNDVRNLEGLDRCDKAFVWLRFQGDRQTKEFNIIRDLINNAKNKFCEEGTFFADKKK